MSVTKQERLENALNLAKEFQSGVKNVMKRLKEFVDQLRGLGPVSEDIDSIKAQISQTEVR